MFTRRESWDSGSSVVGANIADESFVRRLDMVPLPEMVAYMEPRWSVVGLRDGGLRDGGDEGDDSCAVMPRLWDDFRIGVASLERRGDEGPDPASESPRVCARLGVEGASSKYPSPVPSKSTSLLVGRFLRGGACITGGCGVLVTLSAFALVGGEGVAPTATIGGLGAVS